EDQAELIEARFPKLNRCLTGYDLAHLREGDGRFNLNSVLCGAEGSLGFVVEAKLNVLPIPRYSVLVNVRYAGFMDALRDARALMAHRPLSIETVDSKVLLLAMKDFVWSSVAEYFPQDGQRPTLGINLVEFSGDDPQEVDGRVQAFIVHLGADTSVERLGHTLAAGNAAVHRVYAMRKRAVGLLGNVAGEARPQPFVEDTAVPPENLPEFIAEFRALLDSHGLQYGMFGHVDAGVLHVRPILDMKNPVDAALVRPISDAVAELTQRHGGLLWGEHGKGLRSEYVPAFFGELDRQIDERVWQSYGAAMHCNGNGACYNFDPDDAMCPSWKATRQRVHSPKGRASLMREWLRLQGQAGVNVLEVAQRPQPFLSSLAARWRNSRAARRGEADFSHEVYDAMAGCLACKSCAGQCPVKVNVPEFRSRFLELYHRRYLRPVRDYLIGSLEFTMPWLARMPALYNGVMGSPWMRDVLSRRIGMVDGPLLSRLDLAATLRQWKVRAADAQALAALSPEQRARSVVIVQDSFTRYFETGQLQVLIELAARLGFQVWLAPLLPNGKPLHVQGFMGAFAKAAIRNAAQLAQLAQPGVALVGLDPAMTLAYRQEYLKVPGMGEVPKVALPQEWLQQVLPEARTNEGSTGTAYRLLPHCTEKTNAPDSGKQWAQLFERRGLRLSVEATGCCGMSGTYGHEARNLETSKTIYAQSWARQIEGKQELGEPLATGYSCRSQVKRLSARQVRHPLEALLDHVRATHQG
ncbi:MAG: hypothetical protein DI604_28330, partial [Delftia acidovorans]